MTNMSIIKSLSDIDNKELFPVSFLSSLNVWSSSGGDNEEEEKIDTNDPISNYLDMLEILGSLVCSLWQKS